MAQLHLGFSIKDAARLLGMSEAGVRRLCIDNKIGTKTTVERRLSSDDLEKLANLPKKKQGRPRIGHALRV